MITKEEILPYKNQYVSIGVKHLILEGKLFFYSGTVKSVTDTEVKLQTRSGFKIVPLRQIMDIHLFNRRYL